MTVQLVGILNITPDSFSDGGQYFDTEKAVNHADTLFNDGASIVDIGAESTKPNATALTHEQEWARLKPVLEILITKYPNQLSLDTYHPENAEKALAIGPIIINDVTGLSNPEMIQIVLSLQPRIIISHLPGTNIQDTHQAIAIDTSEQVKSDLLKKAAELIKNGFPKENIILDPGIGFGKTMRLNEELLSFGDQITEYPVMIGYSRKRFLGENRMELAPNIAAGEIASSHGATFLRVHDVAGHKQLGF